MVNSPKDQAKADKKAAKARLKAEKKAAKASSHIPPTAGGGDGSSPAERAAAAAEKQVSLQRFRVLFALLMFLVATATFLWTVKPWRYLPGSQHPNPAQEVDEAPAP